ncbi:MAG TPA: MBL fold metallo-hydrolase [Rubrivivax sp.]|nr:MBL fold metallo-hydrolase [Rubrivivax sp.]
MARTSTDPLAGITVCERGWLSANNVLIHAAPGEAGALLVDTSHVNHAAQTQALVAQALAGRPLARIVNTHLHSDHCGGNAALQRAFGVPVAIPPGLAAAVQAWDEDALSYRATGQRMAPFRHDALIRAGEVLRAGGRDWELVAAPGHDPDMLMLFDRARGVLLSADALWENGFGVIFPEVAGEPGFEDQQAVLECIARLPVKLVVPGHGRPFVDVDAALERARTRLQGFRKDPARHAQHAVKVLVKYHLMEEGAQPLADLLAWGERTPLLHGLWLRHPPSGVHSPRAWLERVVGELAQAGALRVDGDRVLDA